MGVEFRILGPLEVLREGEPQPLGTPKQRALLALLLIRRGQVVSSDALVDLLWGAEPPPTAANALQGHVSRLRKLLGPNDIGARLVTGANGYRIDCEADELDAARFEALVREGRAAGENGRDAEAAELLRDALSLWRGPALADFAFEPFAEHEAGRLEELRLAALEERIGAELAVGRHAEVVAELTALAADHPVRERLQAQLMLALYRSGRQADALAAYRRARDTLVDELGLEVGAELRELERAILAQDPELRLEPPPELRAAPLPAPVTGLVGRERETAEVVGLLDGGVRLITLSGPGGIGKTRLALEVAKRVAAAEHEVAFVDLSPLADPDLVPQALADALGIREVSGSTLTARLAQALAPRALLLVLDNFEQVVAAAVEVASLLRAAPRLAVVVTSREVLRLQGEHEYPVEPLEETPAAALFLERARAVRRGYEPGATDLQDIAELCHRLDGLPLALELAAARVKLLSPGELLERLDGRLDLLSRHSVDAPERHRTLRATLDWGYELLPDVERSLFCGLSAFAGGAALDAVGEVCAIPDADVLDIVGSLLDKSLVRREDLPGSAPRLLMLETVRDYAVEQLEASGRAEEARRRHAAWFFALAERAEPELWGAGQLPWLERLTLEAENLRAALRFFAAQGEGDELLRLAAALRRFWAIRGHLAEGLDWLDRALEAGVEDDTLALRGLSGAVNLAQLRGEYERARAYAERAVELGRAGSDGRGLGRSLTDLATVLADQGEFVRARALHEESVALFRTRNDLHGLASSLVNLGDLDLILGDYGRAGELAQEGLAVFREVGDRRGIAISLSNIGCAALYQGRAADAVPPLRESLEVSVELGDSDGVAYCLDALAAAAAAASEWERSACLSGAADGLRDSSGSSLEPAEAALRGRTLALLDGALSQDAFARATADGRSLDLTAAVRYALED
jgi:predicted ATPase/DNA-binding SARP family transcriptional activator